MTIVRFVQRLIAPFVLTVLSGCGDDSSVAVCFGDPAFCHAAFQPVAKAGPDQTVASGDNVTLDGSNSEPSGSIHSYSWVQAGGPAVAISNANKAKASLVAPEVVGTTELTFRLTVVDSGNRADTGSTVVTVQPKPVAAVASALALFDGALQPANGAGVVRVAAECASATVGLTPDHAAAQRGLWLAARSIAIVKGVDTNDPSAFLDAARVLVAEHAVSTADVAGRVESFGFLLLGSFAQDRDPALSEAIAARLRGAVMPDDPAALLSGRSRVADSDGVAIEAVADPAAAATQAIERLLTARFGCVGTSEALELTEAGLLVIGAAGVAD